MHVPVFLSVHVFQKYAPGVSSTPSGGFSPTSSAATVHPGAETGAEVEVGPDAVVTEISVGGTTVSVGMFATSVKDAPACTV